MNRAFLALALGLVGLGAGVSQAATLTLELTTEFSGADAPEGPSPWATAVFDDSFGGANTVRLTMSNTNLVGVEFSQEWYFNFDPALDATLLTFAPFDSSASLPAISTGIDAFMADGDGFFDVAFDFPPPTGTFSEKFTAGESVVYDITYVSPITAGSFDFSSVQGGGAGTFRAAVHVQGIGPGGLGSGWIGVPEPSALLLVPGGLLALAALRRRA